MRKIEIYLIRHPKVKINPSICYGKSDVDIIDSYKEDVSKILKEINITPETKIYSSPSIRCSKVAKELSKNNFLTDKRLMEMNFGEWELKPWDEIDRKKFDFWATNFVNTSPPGGESFLELKTRAIESFLEIINKKSRKILIITHSGIIRAILSEILSFPLERAFILNIDFSSITKITIKWESEEFWNSPEKLRSFNPEFFQIDYVNLHS